MKPIKDQKKIQIASNYRTLYGKLFAALLKQFGGQWVTQIEDAIQNAFYKSLKSWKPHQIPENPHNWLYVVAKNDLLNQLKKEQQRTAILEKEALYFEVEEKIEEDLRLQTILLFAQIEQVSTIAKTVFILKLIFGLSVQEISACTLVGEAAIYKMITRTKKTFKTRFKEKTLEYSTDYSREQLTLVEEILYAVFNIGFDSFKEKDASIVNDDLCLESLALSKVLYQKFKEVSTRNLMALLCFHLARVPTKVEGANLIPFFEQASSQWNADFMKLGVYYLAQPKELDKYYIEALITSKHMTNVVFDVAYWEGIIILYQILFKITNSPIVQLNLAYCLHQAKQSERAVELLESIETELPPKHFYFALVKADILKGIDQGASDEIIQESIESLRQEVRIKFLSKTNQT